MLTFNFLLRFVTKLLAILRSAQTRKHYCRNILSQCCSQYCMGAQTGKKQNIFASETQILRLQDMLLGYANEETFGKHSKCFFNVSQVIPRLLPYATYVEDTKSASWKQKMLLKFFKNIFCILDAILLPQQCSLVCAGLYVYVLLIFKMITSSNSTNCVG